MKGKRITKDLLNRVQVVKNYRKNLLNKALSSNEFLSQSQRLNAIKNLKGITRIRNRCIETNRARSIYRTFKLSRCRFHALAGLGILPRCAKIFLVI